MARTGKHPETGEEMAAGAAREPWRILPGESARAYAAFSAYRDMGPERSQQKLSALIGKNLGSLESWSLRHRWPERCRAFDEQAADLAATESLEDAVKVRIRQARDARLMQAKALEKIRSTVGVSMSVREATDLWRIGADAERRALGIAEKLEHSGPNGGPIPIDLEQWRRDLGLGDGGGDDGSDRDGA